MEYTEKLIQSIIRSKFFNSSKYIIENLYFFASTWESDVFILKNNGYIIEVEIKISVSDFKADVKKTVKHETLVNGIYKPNKFFYCVPESLVDKIDIPKYAGLLVVSTTKGIYTHKEAPFLHKNKLDVDGKIAQKMYNRWRSQVIENIRLTEKIKNLKRVIAEPNLFNTKFI